MEYIKILGVILVILAGTGLGACPVHKMKQRTKELEDLYYCLLRLKSEIGHGGKPLPEAIRSAAECRQDREEGRYRRMMKNLANQMEVGREAYEVLLRKCAAEELRDGVITKEERDSFVDTFLLLGGGDKEKQTEMLLYYAENIRTAVGQEKQKKRERAYLYRSLGVLGGIFVSVILY